MDQILGNLLAQTSLQGHQSLMQNVGVIGQNLMQGLGVVNTSLIQTNASVSDDSAVIAALQTASRAPVQGANDAIK